ncbi:magnesium-transporting ATPase [Klosneuvirus KNV1]|uniref:Magnesium-transporting ATPase n=1 Tax=Klosneuvirus KNV1 TaxID=1977640 RepID=A0A1V0SID9_9VIRU|nr:magnesium-transporting ATPase [Klosneuvirus KNV1]
MLEVLFGISNTNFSNNEVKRTKHSIFWIPLLTIYKYFFWNYENIYFLFLSLFQLSTLYFLPKEWSPTGPYSTAIPLGICILAEIITHMITWYNDWITDYKENNKEYECLDHSYQLIKKKNRNIYPGDIIHLEKEDICPIDGILIDTTNNEKYSKISLALLTGESNINYVIKPAKLFKLQDYKDYKINISNYHQNNFNNIEGKLLNGKEEHNIQGENFVVGGSIIKSDDIYLWVIGCGRDKKSYLKKSVKNDRKKNRIDTFVGNYMINVNAILLLLLILITTTIKLVNSFSFGNIIFYMIQNWILFNGIMPFSVKIFLLLARNLQTGIHNYYHKSITINNSLLIDDIGKINKILTDKTGTLTKNELEFSKLLESWKNDIIDVETYQQNYYDIDLNFHKCIGLCIHQTEENYSTPEDKTLRYRYQYLNNRINQTSQIITLTINNNNYDYKYIEIGGLDFTFERRLSSKIVKDISTDSYYIYCKGAMDVIGKKIKTDYKTELKRLDQMVSQKYPELRLLACAFRKIDKNELDMALHESTNKSQIVTLLENDLHLLGIIGIKDNLQEGVKETIEQFNHYGLFSCLLTGDRKITALAIAKEAGIIDHENTICDFTQEMLDKDITNLHKKTILFGGALFDIVSQNVKYSESFYDKLALSRNFIGYNLIPEHKKKLTNILENKNIKTLTVGDGFNDIGMFHTSSMSIAIKGNGFVESNADFTIKEFKQLKHLFDMSLKYYSKNAQLVNLTFLRASAVIMSIMTYSLIYYNQTTSLFNGFVIQAFNFAWTILGVGYYTLKQRNLPHQDQDYYQNKHLVLTNYKNTSIWNGAGIIFGIVLTLMNYYWFRESKYFGDICGLMLVMILNGKLILNNKLDLWGIGLSLMGIVNFMGYMMYMGSLYDVIITLLTTSKYYWLGVFGMYFGINLFIF